MVVQETLVFIPSQLCTGRVWRAQIEALAGRANTIVGVHTAHASMAALAASILDAAPIQFSLAAHGMGGFVALEIMRQAPGRVTRLALFDTLAKPDTEKQIERRRGYAALVEGGAFDQVVEERIPLLFHPDRQRDPALLDVARAMAQETGAAAFLRQQAAIIARPDSRPGLSDITCPTLVALGDHDGIVALDDAEEIAEGIPGATLHLIANCGHLSPLEKPAAVSALLKAWLDG